MGATIVPKIQEDILTMAILQVITAENPILRQKAKKVHRPDASIERLIEDMVETMHYAHGVALAAPQIAKTLLLFLAEHQTRKLAIIPSHSIMAHAEQTWP